MVKYGTCNVLQLLFILECVSLSYAGSNMGPECSSLSEIQIHYKNYYSLFLGDDPLTFGLAEHALFVKMIREASQLCCSTASVTFQRIRETRGIEELVLDAVKADRHNPNDGVLKLFFPEFAYKKLLQVYDTQTPFIRLSRSPGPALVRNKPKPKDPVFVGEIFVKSWAIMIFLITFAWVIGILVWVCDHHVNPKDFPSPFYIGMIEGFWWSVVTMTTVGYGDKTPKGAVARVLAVLWIMISTVFLSLFTANASSILAISQAEEDISNTLAKTIGCFNSKHFFDVELNLGARWVDFDDLFSIMVSSQTGVIDRIVFPNYLDWLYLRTLPENALMRDEFQLTNTLDHPFQLGMTYAVDPMNMTFMEESFLKCLRNELPTLEKKNRRESFDASRITSDEEEKEEKVPLDSDALLTLTYWFFVIIACLIALGLSWDFWMYWKENIHGHHGTEQQGDVEMAEVSNTDMDGRAQSGGLDEDGFSNQPGYTSNIEPYEM